jgi:two-component system nitrogen regulation response regulator GlnG
MVAVKTFREDLYYRLNVVRLRLPALRQRKGDIPLLVEFMFHRLAARKIKARAKRLSPEALAVLADYEWPGNVRELENAIQRALIVARGETVMTSDLPPEILERTRYIAPPTNAGIFANEESTVAENAQEGAQGTGTSPILPEEKEAEFVGLSSTKSKNQPEPETRNSESNSKVAHLQKDGESDVDALDEKTFFDNFYAHLRKITDKDLLSVVGREFILRAMEETEGNRLQTSVLLGISRSTVQDRVSRIPTKAKSPQKKNRKE